jgi:hypothetical protein
MDAEMSLLMANQTLVSLFVMQAEYGGLDDCRQRQESLYMILSLALGACYTSVTIYVIFLIA